MIIKMKSFSLLFFFLLLFNICIADFPSNKLDSQFSNHDPSQTSSIKDFSSNEKQLKKIQEKLGLDSNQHSHYQIGLYYVTDYENYKGMRHNISNKLNVFTNFIPLSCENKSLTLYYKKKQFKLCDITNIKIYWNFDESKESDLFNEHCFIVYIKDNGAFLFCSVKIEDKVLMLNLITDYSAFCSTKIRLLSFANKQELFKDWNDSENIYEKQVPEGVSSSNINQINEGEEMIFIQKNIIEQSNDNDIPSRDTSRDHGKTRIRYRMLAVNNHILLKTKGFYANIKKSGIKNKDNLSIHFDKTKIYMTNEGINVIQKKKNYLMRFYLNNVVPERAEPTRILNISFNRFICKFERSLLYLSTLLVNSNIIEDNFYHKGRKMISYCLRVKECKEDKNVMFCFSDQKSFQRFKKMYTTALILYHFVLRIDELLNHSNTKKNIGRKLDRFILQNISDMQNRAQVKKQQSAVKFNNRYKVPNTQFRRPIYNGIAFLDDLKNRLKIKVEKRDLPFYLNTSLRNNTNNTMPSLDTIMGRRNGKGGDNEEGEDEEYGNDKESSVKEGSNSKLVKKPSKLKYKSKIRLGMKGRKNTNKLRKKSKKLPKRISLTKGKNKMKIVYALAKRKTKKLTRKIFRNNNYMEVYNNRKDIQTDLKSKPYNKIMEDAGIL